MRNNNIKGLKVLLGVTGGIAAYKSADICRQLVKAGADVQVVMSKSACEFITPLTMETLSGKPVPVDMFGRTAGPLEHIDLPDQADVMLVAPATADYLARCAAGRASDLISSITLAFDGQIIVAPAMNTNMWNNPATRRNLKTLQKDHGFHVIPPGSGMLACGIVGEGRLEEPEKIVEQFSLVVKKDLSGKKIVVTAGPTVEDLDPVRYISNRSSGKTGYAIAANARSRGAEVCLISGPTALDCPAGVSLNRVRSAVEMEKAVLDNTDNADAVIMCAAVADYRPVDYSDQKIKKADTETDTISIKLQKNPDILRRLGSRLKDSSTILVGFALETNDLIENARKKLESKGADYIVANKAEVLEGDSTEVVLLDRFGAQIPMAKSEKGHMAAWLLDQLFEEPSDK